MNICYTYWTNGGENVSCGFDYPSLFFQSAEKSLKLAAKQPYKDNVIVYTDDTGYDVLTKNIPKIDGVSFILVDFDRMPFDKRFWNFPKLVTYALQDDFFIHIDFDVFLKPDFLEQIDFSADIVTEKLRDYDYKQEFEVFNKNNKNPNKLICSGLLGGCNLDAFKENFKLAQIFCREPKENENRNVNFFDLISIEEFALTKMAAQRQLSIQELSEDSFLHFQGKYKHKRYGDIINEYKV